ncbi:MAG TPA: hypothetical protein VNL77_17750 [Roseiflexaceae bacterium]|nr:hypothetical protein [Roseiflexaceae bacterium]
MTTHTDANAAHVAGGEQRGAVIEEQLYCALTGVPIRHDEAYWAPPLITARQLVTTVATTLLRAPGTLGQVLLEEQPNVPYAPAAREQLAARRSAEQLKLLVGLLLAVALVALPLIFLTM